MKASAPDELLDRFAAVLADLAERHGLSNLRHGGPGTVVADVEPGRTLSDLARFELEAESLLDHEVFVVSSDAPAAHLHVRQRRLELPIGDWNGPRGESVRRP